MENGLSSPADCDDSILTKGMLENIPHVQVQVEVQSPEEAVEDGKGKGKRGRQKRQGPYPCQSCEKIFQTMKGLVQHAVIHTDDKPFRCKECDKCFRFKSNLFEHKSVHSGALPYICKLCKKTCRLKGNMKKHLKTHVKNGELTKEETFSYILRGPGAPGTKTNQGRKPQDPSGILSAVEAVATTHYTSESDQSTTQSAKLYSSSPLRNNKKLTTNKETPGKDAKKLNNNHSGSKSGKSSKKVSRSLPTLDIPEGLPLDGGLLYANGSEPQVVVYSVVNADLLESPGYVPNVDHSSSIPNGLFPSTSDEANTAEPTVEMSGSGGETLAVMAPAEVSSCHSTLPHTPNPEPLAPTSTNGLSPVSVKPIAPVVSSKNLDKTIQSFWTEFRPLKLPGANIHCPKKCSGTFDSRAELDAHLKEEHGSELSKNFCQTCQRFFETNKAYNSHVATHEKVRTLLNWSDVTPKLKKVRY